MPPYMAEQVEECYLEYTGSATFEKLAASVAKQLKMRTLRSLFLCTLSFRKAIVTSRSITLSDLFIFLIDLVPCQNSGSLSTSEIIFQTLETGALIFF